MTDIYILYFLVAMLPVATGNSTYFGDKDDDYSLDAKWGSPGSGDGEFNVPHTLAFDSTGNAYITDTNNHRIQKFSSDGKFITKWGSKGTGDGEFVLPLGIDADSSNNIYVIDQGKVSLERFTSNGTFIPLKLKPPLQKDTGLSVLEDVEIDRSDNIYITDRGEQNIKKYNISAE